MHPDYWVGDIFGVTRACYIPWGAELFGASTARLRAPFSPFAALNGCWYLFHEWCSAYRISLYSLFDKLTILESVDSALFSTFWTATIMAKLTKTAAYIGHGLLKHIDQTNNIKLTFFLQKSSKIAARLFDSWKRIKSGIIFYRKQMTLIQKNMGIYFANDFEETKKTFKLLLSLRICYKWYRN